ncbi:unnamed protein product [Dovyalis caffra]|uniref:Response regulatory domain-containing protein n=1 Tax=Dovyalis caffra TaxID=77055 RepID=A0AAV1RBN2_9ROSI|nr:unnamed protein product [Dovyalis caffra]
MGSNSIVSNRWMSEKMDCFDLSHHSNSDDEDEEVHVLAVDDSVVDRKVIERLLKISSCKVTAVDSGWRALKLLGLLDEEDESSPSSSVGFDVSEGLKVDLIITDYCMPGMTGYELLKKIKESSTFREVPVVIMSSENVIARIDRCLEEGAEDFIVKPVKLSDVKRIRDYMGSRDVRSIPNQERSNCNINKRKLQESFDLSLSSSPPSISSSSSSLSSPSPSPTPTPSPPSLFSASAPYNGNASYCPIGRIFEMGFCTYELLEMFPGGGPSGVAYGLSLKLLSDGLLIVKSDGGVANALLSRGQMLPLERSLDPYVRGSGYVCCLKNVVTLSTQALSEVLLSSLVFQT